MTIKTYTQAELRIILDNHRKRINGEPGGERAILRGANLRSADLYEADLRSADLYGADLRGAILRGANLRSADLYEADLRSADLYGADLRGADLRGADLYGANLRSADLCGADLRGADLRSAALYGADLQGADLYGSHGAPGVVTLTLPLWSPTIYEGSIAIGCQHHTVEEWRNYNDEEISRMDGDALEWWKVWKVAVLAAADAAAKVAP